MSKKTFLAGFFFNIICLIVCMLLVWFIRKDKGKFLKLFGLLTDIYATTSALSVKKNGMYHISETTKKHAVW